MSEFKLKPLADKLVIEIIEESETTPGGIFIPNSAREKSQRGRVIAVGAGKMLDSGKREEMEVQVGNIVLFAKYSGADVKFETKELKILSEKEILAVVE